MIGLELILAQNSPSVITCTKASRLSKGVKKRRTSLDAANGSAAAEEDTASRSGGGGGGGGILKKKAADGSRLLLRVNFALPNPPPSPSPAGQQQQPTRHSVPDLRAAFEKGGFSLDSSGRSMSDEGLAASSSSNDSKAEKGSSFGFQALGLHLTSLFRCLPDSVWGAENRAELARCAGAMLAEPSKQSQHNIVPELTGHPVQGSFQI